MKKIFTLIGLTTIIYSVNVAQTCDTLFNLTSPLDTPVYYVAATVIGTDSGYVSGNNIFGDSIKAEGFPAHTGYYVSQSMIYFAIVTINPSDSDNTVTVKVWDNTGTSNTGAPGNVLDSATITLAQIAQSVAAYNNGVLQGALVNFTGGLPLETDTFYIGVVLPQKTGDTVVLATNTVPPGPDGDGWEFVKDEQGIYVWGTYDNDWRYTGGRLGNYIAVSICSGPTGINTISNEVMMKIYPNPANDQLNFQWSLNDEAGIVMYDITGKSINSFTVNGNALSTFDIHDLASGTYVIRVTDRQSNEQRSMLFTKL